MSKPAAIFNNVTKTFKIDVGSKPIKALDDISFQVQQGEVLGIIGPNGAGKSTSLKILLGFIKQDQGEVQLNNHPPTSPKSHEAVGYLPEHPCLYKHLTIYDHLHFVAKIHKIPTSETQQKITDLLKRVNLYDNIKLPIKRFSKGMTQRGALAYALLPDPNILILDEPMSGLDPVGRQLVLDIIQEYKQKGTTILFCSHILTDVERICDRISIMHKGKLAATITPNELKKTNAIKNNPLQSPLESFFFQTIKPEAQ